MMLGNPTPNPANRNVTVSYDIGLVDDRSSSTDENVPVTIDVADAEGTIVATLVSDTKLPGYYTASLAASSLPNGAYLLRMTAGNYRSARKFIIQK